MIYDREFQVYTDQSQCERFDVPYFERDAKLVIAASRLLVTKDYDKAHRKFLAQFGSRTIVMERTADQGPGWWRVTEVI
mgnify:CR=1 FL=1|tara:strand:- start:268 stop:504 length:237 start_codon:yes stop_codon:yes gene_type:complete